MYFQSLSYRLDHEITLLRYSQSSSQNHFARTIWNTDTLVTLLLWQLKLFQERFHYHVHVRSINCAQNAQDIKPELGINSPWVRFPSVTNENCEDKCKEKDENGSLSVLFQPFYISLHWHFDMLENHLEMYMAIMAWHHHIILLTSPHERSYIAGMPSIYWLPLGPKR